MLREKGREREKKRRERERKGEREQSKREIMRERESMRERERKSVNVIPVKLMSIYFLRVLLALGSL